MLKERAMRIALYGSVLLHMLSFLLYYGVRRLYPLSTHSPSEKSGEIEKRIEFELVETPEDAQTETPPEDARLLSDKNAVAREETPPEEKVPDGLPYAEGDFEIKNLPHAPPHPDAPPAAESVPEEFAEDRSDGDGSPESETTTFLKQIEAHRDFLKDVRRDLESARSSPSSGLLGADRQVQFDNRTSSAKNVGGLSFNTYNWNFAPYMLEMKRRIEGNMFPPPAFRLGLLGSATTVIRFRIARTGQLRSVERLSHDGHKWLESTSEDAIELSAPFPPLPADFPKEYLEVTGKFLYILTK